MTKRVEKGICGICPANCGVTIELENDRITGILPWKEHVQGVPCIRGRHAPEIVYSPDRIKTPLKRKGPRGSLDFEKITWDQALDEIAGVIIKLKNRYGPECIASFLGRGNFETSLWQMFSPREKGFTVGSSLFMPLGSPNAFSVGSVCWVSYGLMAPLTTFGRPMGMLQPDIEKADVVFIWGGNPATDSPLTNMRRLQAAKKRGATLIAIDPLRTESAQISDYWVPIRPGTDGALIYGLLRHCFNNKAIDREFGEAYCEGFFELEAYVTQFTASYVEHITGIPKERIAFLGDIFASSKRLSFLTYSGLEYSNMGFQSIRALLTLWALTGNLDIEGAMRFQSSRLAKLRRPDVRFPRNGLPPIGMDRYPLYCEITKSGHFMEFPRSVLYEDPYKIRFLMVGGASILTGFPNVPLFTRAMNALEYQVSVNLFKNADALYADMLLPAASYFETESYSVYPPLSAPLGIQHRKQVIEPVGEAMSNYMIYAKLAERLGYGHLYPQSDEAMVRYVTADCPLEFDDFKKRSERGPISLADPSRPLSLDIEGKEKKWLSGKLRPDGKPGFPTPSGKWEIISSRLKEAGADPFPTWVNSKEGLRNEALVKDYPLILTTGTRIQSSFRSQHLNIPGLIKRQPMAEAILHTSDARPRNISTGDRVRVKTRRGTVEFSARVTPDIRKGVVEVNMGGGSPIQAKGWRNSNINLITDSENRNDVVGFPVYKALLCDVEKL